DDLAPSAYGQASDISIKTAPADGTAMLFTGYITATADGEYTFTLSAGASALLRIHEATVIDAGFTPAPVEKSGTIRLATGKHPFRLHLRRAAPDAPWPQIEW